MCLDALDVLCAQLTRDLFTIAKFLVLLYFCNKLVTIVLNFTR